MTVTFKRLFNRPCCPCFGGAPGARCACKCHRQEDCEFWETVAVAWLCDAKDEKTRNELWQRFATAYPQHVHETCEQFWSRIQKTRWYSHNRHRFEHHHPYAG